MVVEAEVVEADVVEAEGAGDAEDSQIAVEVIDGGGGDVMAEGGVL